MLCDHLEGWDREGGREGDARGKRYGNKKEKKKKKDGKQWDSSHIPPPIRIPKTIMAYLVPMVFVDIYKRTDFSKL